MRTSEASSVRREPGLWILSSAASGIESGDSLDLTVVCLTYGFST